MDQIKGLRFGSLSRNSLHLCVDMQKLFAYDSPWASAAVAKALPAVREITRHRPEQTIFSRFLCPIEPMNLMGQWLRFYADCPQMLQLDRRLFEIMDELRSISDDSRTVDREVFSVFRSEEFRLQLVMRKVDTLVFTGVETDVCVLASVLTAIDEGLRVVVVEDAVASSNPNGHHAALTAVMPRFDQQIELISTDTLLNSWA